MFIRDRKMIFENAILKFNSGQFQASINELIENGEIVILTFNHNLRRTEENVLLEILPNSFIMLEVLTK
jgi:hypothetical protein